MMRMISNFCGIASWSCPKGRVLGHSSADVEVSWQKVLGDGSWRLVHMMMF